MAFSLISSPCYSCRSSSFVLMNMPAYQRPLNRTQAYHHCINKSSFSYSNTSSILNSVQGGFLLRRKKKWGTTVRASLFGVGAPEALVIGVVALLVFGPKGLAEVAKTLGKSLRAFQPTIRELQQVSREFKSTLEQEIGIDELRSDAFDPYKRNSEIMQNEKLADENGSPGMTQDSENNSNEVKQTAGVGFEDASKVEVPDQTKKVSSNVESSSEIDQSFHSVTTDVTPKKLKSEDDKPKDAN